MTKDQARGRLRDAVRYGRIVKPKRCSRCGAETEARMLHGHHAKGYDRPLDVEWLCIKCHNAEDRDARVANGHRMRANLIPNAYLIFGKQKSS